MEVRGEVLSRLCGVGTFLPWVLGCHPDFESHFCYKPGCCGRLNIPGGGGQNGCGEGCGPVGGVEASVELQWLTKVWMENTAVALWLNTSLSIVLRDWGI